MNLNKEQIKLHDLLAYGLEKVALVDVRSQSEFALDHIPGSINIPILDDEQRKIVGTTYKQIGPNEARLVGVDLVSPKLPQMIREYLDLAAQGKPIVLYCWRGGLRSFSAAALVRLAGVKIARIEGGYAEFRKVVHTFMENGAQDYRFATVYGPTGCGKTEILRNLEKQDIPVADLERAAHHKGSSFGKVGEPGFARVTQKNFESAVWRDIYRHRDRKLFLTEGESRKIGKVWIPKPFFDTMTSGVSIVADCPLDFRVDFTIENYQPTLYIDEIRTSLNRLKQQLGAARLEKLNALLDNGEFREFTSIMMTDYYDPMYKHSFPDQIDYTISYASLAEGEAKFAELYRELEKRGEQ